MSGSGQGVSGIQLVVYLQAFLDGAGGARSRLPGSKSPGSIFQAHSRALEPDLPQSSSLPGSLRSMSSLLDLRQLLSLCPSPPGHRGFEITCVVSPWPALG